MIRAILDRFWHSYRGFLVCRALGHKDPVSIPYHANPERSYSGCARCGVHLMDFSKGVRGKYKGMFDNGYTITVHHEDHDVVTFVPGRRESDKAGGG